MLKGNIDNGLSIVRIRRFTREIACQVLGFGFGLRICVTGSEVMGLGDGFVVNGLVF
jgi:hypothetical protein